MLNRFLYPLFLLFPFLLPAQQVDLRWSEEFPLERRGLISLIGQDDQQIFVLRQYFQNRLKLYLEAYDTSFTKRLEIALPANPRKLKSSSYLNSWLLNDSLFIFTRDYIGSKKLHRLQVTIANREGEILVPHRTLDSIRVDRQEDLTDFRMRLARDSSTFLYTWSEKYRGNDPERIGMLVLNPRLEARFTKRLLLPFKEKNVILAETHIDNQGVVYALVKITPPVRAVEKGQSRYYYSIFSWAPATGTTSEYELKLGKKYIDHAHLTVEPSGQLFCSGFFSTLNSRISKGFFYLRIDSDSKALIARGLQEIPDLYPPKLKPRDKLDYTVREVYFLPDSSSVVIGEQYRLTISRSWDYRTGYRALYTYFYKNIVAIQILPDGSIGPVRRIAKNQITNNDGGFYSSFLSGMYRDDFYFMFNDHPKNLKTIWKDQRVKGMPAYRKAIAVVVRLKPEGEASKAQLFRGREHGTVLRPGLYLQTNENTFLIVSEYGNTFRLGKMTLLE